MLLSLELLTLLTWKRIGHSGIERNATFHFGQTIFPFWISIDYVLYSVCV